MLGYESNLAVLRAEGDAFAAAASKDLAAPVPSCPEWDMAELVRHTAEVHRHKAAVIRSGEAEVPWPEREQAPRETDRVLDWYRAGLDDLHQLLTEADPAQPARTWGTGSTVAWWARRMAQETAVHRWDAENAVGDPTPIAPDVAVDGIDEFLSEFIPGEEIPWPGDTGTVHLHCTDTEGEWTVGLRPGEVPIYEPGHSKGEVALRGSAPNLLMFLWRRVEPSAVEVLGNEALARAFWNYLEGPGQ